MVTPFLPSGDPFSSPEAAAALRRGFDALPPGGVCVAAWGSRAPPPTRAAVDAIRDVIEDLARPTGAAVRVLLDRMPGMWVGKAEGTEARRHGGTKGEDNSALSTQRSALSIALVTAWDDAHAALGAISGPNKRRYCERHGYAYIERTGGDFDRSRPAAWSKLRFIREALATTSGSSGATPTAWS